MVVIVNIDVLVKMEANAMQMMDIVFVCQVIRAVDVNCYVHREHTVICVYKNVNVEVIMFVIREQV